MHECPGGLHGARVVTDEMEELAQHGGGRGERQGNGAERLFTGLVPPVVAVEQREDRTGVDQPPRSHPSVPPCPPCASRRRIRSRARSARFGSPPAIEGDTATTIGYPRAPVFDPFDGSFYVSDTYWKRVLRFDRHGGLVRSCGRPGPGPGEFGFDALVFVRDDSTVVVVDERTNRLKFFDRDSGEYRRERVFYPGGETLSGSTAPVRIEDELWFVPASLDAMPVEAFRGDTLFVLDRRIIDDARLETWLVMYQIDLERCDWIPLTDR